MGGGSQLWEGQARTGEKKGCTFYSDSEEEIRVEVVRSFLAPHDVPHPAFSPEGPRCPTLCPARSLHVPFPVSVRSLKSRERS